MSVIAGRALPDARDGLKPVHRRILFAMHELGMMHARPHRKCARVVGEVLGKLHPHGDSAVYDALVRLAQPFSMQAPLVDGHGNFGSLDADPPAAMRYTECRLSAYAGAALLTDLDPAVVDYTATFDGSGREPSAVPAAVPNLLINGAAGIAVGIATRVPPHNLREIVAAAAALARDPSLSDAQLRRLVPAPDFPTGGEVLVSEALDAVYASGRGTFTLRATMHVEEIGGGGGRRGGGSANGAAGPAPRQCVVLTELPYQTPKAALVEQLARLADAGTLSGVSDVRDESDRKGTRVVVELRRGADAGLVINQLYAHSGARSRFSANVVALVGAQPRMLGLRAALVTWLEFRAGVVRARSDAALAAARQRLHLVQGYLIALAAADAVVEVVRAAPDAAAAAAALSAAHGLSAQQAEGVLGLTLRRLTSLEAGKLEAEAQELSRTARELETLLASRHAVMEVVAAEAEDVARRFGTPRRTKLVYERRAGEDAGDDAAGAQAGDPAATAPGAGVVSDALSREAVTPNSPTLLLHSARGYLKRLPPGSFAVQGLRGRGKRAAGLTAGDSLAGVTPAHDHDSLLCFTRAGTVHALRAWDVPEAGRTAKGSALRSLLPRAKAGVGIANVLPLPAADGGQLRGDVLLATSAGLIKRVPADKFARLTRVGQSVIALGAGADQGADDDVETANPETKSETATSDELAFVVPADPTDSVLVAASDGRVLHIRADAVRPTSRTAGGNKAMNLRGGARLVGVAALPAGVAEDAGSEEDEDPGSSGSEEDGEDEEEEEGVPGSEASDEEPGVDSAPVSDEDDPSTEGRAGPWLLLVTEQGWAKRVPASKFPLRPRARMGTRMLRGSATPLAALAVVPQGEAPRTDALVSTAQGLTIRCPVSAIRVPKGNMVKGQRLVTLQEGDRVVSVALVSRA